MDAQCRIARKDANGNLQVDSSSILVKFSFGIMLFFLSSLFLFGMEILSCTCAEICCLQPEEAHERVFPL